MGVTKEKSKVSKLEENRRISGGGWMDVGGGQAEDGPQHTAVQKRLTEHTQPHCTGKTRNSDRRRLGNDFCLLTHQIHHVFSPFQLAGASSFALASHIIVLAALPLHFRLGSMYPVDLILLFVHDDDTLCTSYSDLCDYSAHAL